MNAQKSIDLVMRAALIFLLTSVSLFAQEADTAEPAKAAESDEQPSDIGGNWRLEDFKPYVKAIDDLKKFSKEYSDNIFMQSIDEYSKGMDILQDMDAEIATMQKQFDKQNNLNERWYWQEIDRLNQHKRRIGMLKYSAKLKAVTYFTRAINHMDNVQDPEIRKSEKFVNFQIKLFESYVSTQYDIHNLKPCIPILERYIAINDQTKKSVPAYKYLASCYGYMENVLEKYDTAISEERIVIYKQKKNEYLLMATELQYGVDSVQYRKLKDIVEIDEKKSERINDFK